MIRDAEIVRAANLRSRMFEVSFAYVITSALPSTTLDCAIMIEPISRPL
jgi:hypothetical protein